MVTGPAGHSGELPPPGPERAHVEVVDLDVGGREEA